MITQDPPNKLKITKVWMVISVDDKGNEGVCVGPLPRMPGGLMPLIAADEDWLPFIKAMAKRIARETDKTVRLIELSVRTDVEDIKP